MVNQWERLLVEVSLNGLNETDEEILSMNLSILFKLTERVSIKVFSKID